MPEEQVEVEERDSQEKDTYFIYLEKENKELNAYVEKRKSELA